jgi:uncharacterized membrane protein
METKSLTKKIKDFVPTNRKNISPSQRILSILGGAYMLWFAFSSMASKKKTGVVGPIWNAASGGYLLYRGVSGHCAIKDALKGPENKIFSYLHKN